MTYVTLFRVANHILTLNTIPIIVLGVVGAVLGTTLENHLLNRVNLDLVRRVIYVFIGCAGVFYLVSSI